MLAATQPIRLTPIWIAGGSFLSWRSLRRVEMLTP
jgi:hypothetical protein